MKKFLTVFLLSLFCTVQFQTIRANTDDSNRKALTDTIIVTMFDRSATDALINIVAEGQNDLYRKVMECFIYLLTKQDFSEEMDCFSDDDLKLILEFQRSPSYRYLNSGFFLENFISNISMAMDMETGQMNGFSYKMNDKEYSNLWNEYWEDVKPFSDVSNYLNEDNMVAQAKKNGLPEEQVSLVISILHRVFANVGNLYALSCVDYLSKEDIQEMASFLQHPTIRKYLATLHSLGQATDNLDEKDLEQMALEATEDDIIDYFKLSRSIPRFVPVPYRPIMELSIGKSTYSGETRDGLPYGKGVLTDKKGKTYSGNFKNGKRHGQFIVTDTEGNIEVQTWVDGRYVKNLPAADPADGQTPDVQEYMGKLSGYGRHYDYASMTHYEGFFIDGELIGAGTKRTAKYEMTGEFEPLGHFTGTILWKEPEWSVSRFKGKVYGNIREGVYQGTKADGSMSITKNGVFVDSMLDGPASISYSTPEADVFDEGIYAFNELFGNGTRKIVEKDAPDKISVSSIYKGEFIGNLYNGKGHFEAKLTNIPPQDCIFSPCDIKVNSRNVTSLTIDMDGSFDDGKFVEGRVSISTGQQMEGKFVSGKLYEGKETVVHSDGTRAEYTVSGGVRCGNCRIEYADGSVYKGPIEKR